MLIAFYGMQNTGRIIHHPIGVDGDRKTIVTEPAAYLVSET
jgi:hypothetical protein